MKLVHISARNFRCLKDVSLPIHPLTVIIGENDAGKSSLLDLLELVLNNSTPDVNDYYCGINIVDSTTGEITNSTQIEVILDFMPTGCEEPEVKQYLANDGHFYLKKTFGQGETGTFYKGRRFTNEVLLQDFLRMSVAELDNQLENLDIRPEGRLNKAEKINLINEYKETAPTVEDWIMIPVSVSKQLLPRFERYKAIDYKTPESIILKTLRTVYETVIFEPCEDGQQRVVIQSLKEITEIAKARINEKVNELLSFVQQYNPQVKQIDFDPEIDFSAGLKTGEFRIDEGQGLHQLSKKGDGTKRRMLMATFDWDHQVQGVQSQITRPVIRGYDEPDANLHYEAQRKIYKAIAGISEAPDGNIQSLLCTHSLTMIDRAPASHINLFKLSNGRTFVSHLRTDGDNEIEEFLDLLARQLGITNTMLFYERCYIIVEGDTEEYAIPLLYRNLFGRSMLDEGIRLINIGGHGAWLPFLKLLSKNRQDITLTLLDSDSRDENQRKFSQAGFDEELWKAQTWWIGQREFEDAFDDPVWCACLAEMWPRRDGFSWTPSDLPLRTTGRNRERDKYSERLVALVKDSTVYGTRCTKPDLGRALGKYCPNERVPTTIIELLTKARHIAGVD